MDESSVCDHKGFWGYVTGYTPNPWWHLMFSIFWAGMAAYQWLKPFADLHETMGWFAFECWATEYQFSLFLKLSTSDHATPKSLSREG